MPPARPPLATVFLAQLLQQVLSPDQMIVEDLPRDSQQVCDERIAQGFDHDFALSRDAVDQDADRRGAGADQNHVQALSRRRFE